MSAYTDREQERTLKNASLKFFQNVPLAEQLLKNTRQNPSVWLKSSVAHACAAGSPGPCNCVHTNGNTRAYEARCPSPIVFEG